jgi:nucleotide-binding universal stress UspA family protein
MRAGNLPRYVVEPPMFSNILLAVDGSEVSLQAARQGIAFARSLNAKVTVVVATVPSASDFARELAVLVPDIFFPEAQYEHK